MKTLSLAFSLLLFPIVAMAAIAAPDIPKLVGSAEIIVVGKVSDGDEKDGQIHGTVEVTKVVRGEVKVGEKIPVRWRAKPKNLPKGLEHTADYVYAPPLGKEQVVVIQPKKEGEAEEAPRSLNWGSTNSAEKLDEITKMAAAKPAKDSDFVGLTEDEAKKMAAERKITLRVMERDGESSFGTADFRTDRLNLTIVKGKITAVKRG